MIRPFIENKSGENPMVSLHLQMNGNHRHTLLACIHNTPCLHGKDRVHYHHRCSTTRFRCFTLMNHYFLHNTKYQIQTTSAGPCPCAFAHWIGTGHGCTHFSTFSTKAEWFHTRQCTSLRKCNHIILLLENNKMLPCKIKCRKNKIFVFVRGGEPAMSRMWSYRANDYAKRVSRNGVCQNCQ